MKIITRGEAMRIHQQHPASRLFPFCTGKYRWHGSTETYTGREVQDIPGVLAVFAERRKDSFGPYVRLRHSTDKTDSIVTWEIMAPCNWKSPVISMPALLKP